jgi:hypothetical protein
MQKERLREKVNACYGYNAISRIRITQTAADFVDPQPAQGDTAAEPSSEVAAVARTAASGVADDTLRTALEALGRNILTRHSTT